MKRKKIILLVPSELLYAFDPDGEDIFVVSRERGRIIARPKAEAHFSEKCNGCCRYDDQLDSCSLYY